MLKYIFDTSAVLLLICDCKLYNVLKQFTKYNEFYIPIQVYNECMRGKLNKNQLQEIKSLFTIIDVLKNTDLIPFFHGEDKDGEFWVISHALNNDEFYCVIDEKFGSRLCRYFNLKKIGSIGIIKKLLNLNIINNNQLQIIEQRIRNSTFYFTENLLLNFYEKNDNVSKTH